MFSCCLTAVRNLTVCSSFVLADEDDDEIVANGNVKLPVQKAESPRSVSPVRK